MFAILLLALCGDPLPPPTKLENVRYELIANGPQGENPRKVTFAVRFTAVKDKSRRWKADLYSVGELKDGVLLLELVEGVVPDRIVLEYPPDRPAGRYYLGPFRPDALPFRLVVIQDKYGRQLAKLPVK